MAAGTDVKQLLLQVDASISLAQRNMTQLATQVQRETSSMDASLGRVDAASERMGRSFGNARAAANQSLVSLGQYRAGAQQLSFQIGDVATQLSSGTRPAQIFGQQIGQVVQAIGLMRGSAGGLIGFLSGPWGAVITGAVILATSFGDKLFKNAEGIDDLVAKMREQAEQARRNQAADEAWKGTIEGLTEAIRKRREEQEKSLQTDIQSEQQALRQSEGELSKLTRARDKVQREVLNIIRSNPGGRDGRGILGNQIIGPTEERLTKLYKQLADLNSKVAIAEANVRGASIPISERTVAAALDESKAATDRYTQALGRLRDEREKGLITEAAFEKRLKAAGAALEREQARLAKKSSKQTDTGDLTSFISPVSGNIRGRFGENRGSRNHAGIDIAVPVGTPVKAPAGGKIIEAGNLPGYGNVIFIDHGRGTVSRLAHLSQISARKGDVVAQGAVIGLSGGAKGAPGSGNSQGPHVHQEVRVNGRPVDPRTGRFRTDEAGAARSAVASAASEAKRTLREQNVFEQELLRANQELLGAQRELVTGTQEQAQFARDLVAADLERSRNAIVNAEEEGKLTRLQAIELDLKQQAIADQRVANINAREADQLASERNDIIRFQRETEAEVLQHQERLAVTVDQRRAIQHQLVEMTRQLTVIAAQEILDSKTASDQQKRIAQLQIDRANILAKQAHESVEQENATPLEEYVRELSRQSANVDQEIGRIAVNGLESLNDGLVDAITGAKSLGAAFKDVANQIIADLARIFIRQQLIEPLANALLSAGSSGFGGLFGRSAPTPVPAGGMPASGWVGPRAAYGGQAHEGRPMLVGEQGQEIFIPNQSGVILPNRMLRGMGGGSTIVVNVDAKDAVLASTVKGWVTDAATFAIQAGARGGQARVARASERSYP